MTLIVDYADALAESLALHEFTISPPPDVTRDHWPTFDLEDMADPVIAVVPGGIEVSRTARGIQQYDYQLNVFVGRKAITTSQGDAVSELAEEVQDAIWAHDWDEAVQWPTGSSSPMTVETVLNPDDGLAEHNAWRAVLTVTYRSFR